MKILDEPISTWISIAAFLISLSTLLLSWRKQKNDERIMLAGKVTELKVLYSEVAKIIGEILETTRDAENFLKEVFQSEEISNEEARVLDAFSERLSNLETQRSRIERNYKALGHKDPKTTDPVELAAIAVEISDIKNSLEKDKSDIEEMIRQFVATLQLTSKKSTNIKAQRKKPLKKQGITSKRLKRPANAG